jgi:2-polyprenyl-6-methoxyphenol hydroxylase-like FAD-dependent oxidoreductase
MATPFIAFMPQWDFLNFIAEKGRAFGSFRLLMETEVTGLIEEDGRVVGIEARGKEKDIEIRADLVVGADGRHSTVREKAGLVAREFGAPMDVLWFRVSRLAADPKQTFGSVAGGHFMVLIERGEYWQCGFVIPKGGFEEMRSKDSAILRAQVSSLAPFLGKRVEEIRSWDDVKFLSVAVDRLDDWSREGILCIGDAAHAMSPIGGVGINLAIQDAVAAANLLAPSFKKGVPPLSVLRAIQKRRMWPVRATQSLQLLLQKQVIGKVLADRDGRLRAPFLLRLFKRMPFLTALPAHLIGVGVRAERVSASLAAGTAAQSAPIANSAH